MKFDWYTKAVLTLIAVGLCALALGRTSLVAPAAAAPAVADTPTAPPAVAALRQERLATLREARDTADELFAGGTGTFEHVQQVHRLLLDAELAMAATPKARAEILDNAIKVARKQEALSQKRVAAGVATTLETLEAKAYRLGLEIRLAEEGAERGQGK
ncbi:MAG TPA: hypothetical protein VGI81_27575 [Tepidisphaeraceae bacterium]|jgi:outer membrane protein TolC